MERCLREVFEYQNHIKLLQTKLNTFKGGNFDIGKGHDEERRI